jgi:iron-sulfur cluster repair protein YtfE (RIC family)
VTTIKNKTIISLKEKIKSLEKEIAKLMDENQSLWTMLDEITASDIKNWTESLQKEHEKMRIDKLMVTKKMGDA